MAIGSYIVVENGTPYDMELSTAVENPNDWEGDHRPDKNLNKPLKLAGFSGVTRREDVSEEAKTARFTVSVNIKSHITSGPVWVTRPKSNSKK